MLKSREGLWHLAHLAETLPASSALLMPHPGKGTAVSALPSVDQRRGGQIPQAGAFKAVFYLFCFDSFFCLALSDVLMRATLSEGDA